MPVAIRNAERRDLESLGRLGAMLVRVHYAFDRQRFLAPTEHLEQRYASFLGHMLESDDVCVFVAERDGAIVGYVFAALEPLSWKELRGPAGFVHDVVVAEDSRRLGIGENLMRAAIEWLREHGAPRVILGTATQNEAAQALFRRIGFRATMIEMTMEL